MVRGYRYLVHNNNNNNKNITTSVDRRSSSIVDCGEISNDLLLLLFSPVWYGTLVPGTWSLVPEYLCRIAIVAYIYDKPVFDASYM